MNLTDELERLGKLHKDGVLTDDEFALAKDKLLNQPEQPPASCIGDDRQDDSDDNLLGNAANRYVSFQIVMGVLGFILFLIVFFTIFLPHFGGGPRFP